jgi:hypothetical protein
LKNRGRWMTLLLALAVVPVLQELST